MATRPHHILVLTFGDGRPGSTFARRDLPVMAVGCSLFLIVAYFLGADFSMDWPGWSVWGLGVGLAIIGCVVWWGYKSSNCTLSIDGRIGRVTLERRYLYKTVSERFRFADIERFEAERYDDDGSPAVQPRLVLKNGRAIDLGQPETVHVADAEAAIAAAQQALA
jgi:hypothetical protein